EQNKDDAALSDAVRILLLFRGDKPQRTRQCRSDVRAGIRRILLVEVIEVEKDILRIARHIRQDDARPVERDETVTILRLLQIDESLNDSLSAAQPARIHVARIHGG